MLNYYPDSEPATERAFFIRLEDVSGDYPKITAFVVRRAQPTITGEENKPCDGRNACGWRRASWASAKKEALYVEDLQVRAQMDRDAWRPYGADYLFREVLYLERREAKHIARTFDRIDAGIAKLTNQIGTYDSRNYADLLIRVALVLKIKTFVFGDPSAALDSSDLHECGVAHLNDRIDSLLHKARKKFGPAAHAA